MRKQGQYIREHGEYLINYGEYLGEKQGEYMI